MASFETGFTTVAFFEQLLKPGDIALKQLLQLEPD